MARFFHSGVGIASQYGAFSCRQGLGIALITVIHNNVVGITQLCRGLGMLLELLHDVRRIHQGDHPIDAALGRQTPIGQERLYGWSWRGQRPR